ncbi:hypothetical protein Ga0609869_000486 [Rhodovulum iodosum]|uniref:Roadblock/LAMTOR2 domain-containing protein n=1 Tax=Rhodovulum iodosum TaxID=68291 RepID=A0ABV3XPW2_9RHOB|nr:hypothetical protein [Rhodovulum robiginosum]RSK31563.1 hypothetical protein EJA01_15660 [Rhodovulum robiginosum]
MNDTERLRQKLTQLKSAEDEPAGDLSEGLARLAPILAEIDDTVLPRELVFANDRGERVGLVVSGRRLLRVSQIHPRSLATQFGALAGRSLSEEATHEFGLLKRLLTALLDEVETLEISAGRPEPGTAADIGCTTDTLMRLFGADETAELDDESSAVAPPALDGPLAEVAAIALAGLVWQGEEMIDRRGSPETLELLDRVAETDALAAAVPPTQATRCIVLRLPSPAGRALAQVTLRGHRGLFLLRSADAFRVMRLIRPALLRAG